MKRLTPILALILILSSVPVGHARPQPSSSSFIALEWLARTAPPVMGMDIGLRIPGTSILGGSAHLTLPGRRLYARRAILSRRVVSPKSNRSHWRINLDRFTLPIPVLAEKVNLVDVEAMGPPPEPPSHYFTATLNPTTRDVLEGRLVPPAAFVVAALPKPVPTLVPQNWYVRSGVGGDETVGGTTAQCNGHTNVPLAGATGTNCAYANPQDAISAAALGDTIYLHAGQTFNTDQGLIFPDKGAGTSFITVTTDGTIPAVLSTYPNNYTSGVFTRVTTAMAIDMPKVVVTVNQPALYFSNSSHHWEIRGIEVTNSGTVQTNALVGGGSPVPHHLTFDQMFLHPKEEVGDFSNITNRSCESAFIISGDNLTWTRNVIQGFTGYNLAGTYRLNANSILSSYQTNVLIENNLLEASGQLFFSGGGPADPAKTALATNVTYTSATLSNTNGLDVGDIFAIYNRHYSEGHLTPHPDTPAALIARVGHYVNGAITAVNHVTGAVTFTRLTGGLRYRQINLRFWGATSGTYTLTWQGQTTAPITLAAGDLTTNIANIRAALEALSNVNPNDFDATFSNYADVGIFFGMNNGVPSGQWQDYPTGPLLSYDSTFGSPMQVDGANLVGGVRAATAAVHSSESYTILEGDIANPNVDVPDEGALVAWEGTNNNNIMIRRNIFAQHPEWAVASGYVKGFVEIKGGTNITFDGNIFAKRPTGIIVTVRNQGDGGAVPWSEASNLIIKNNLWDQNGYSIAMFLQDGTYQNVASHDILIHNNLFLWPGGTLAQYNPWMQIAGGSNLTITHNTVFSAWEIAKLFSTAPTTGVIIRDNLFQPWGTPFPCLEGPGPCMPGAIADHNLILNNRGIDASSFFSTYGAGAGWEEATLGAVMFTTTNANYDVTGNWTLQAGSPYKAGGARQASDGKDIGWVKSEMVTAMGFDPFVASQNPIVSAGNDQNLGSGTTASSVTGVASDPGSLTLTYLWTQVSGPNTATIATPTALTTDLTDLLAGTYVFNFTATNTIPLSTSDTVSINIAASGVPPTAPSGLLALTISTSQINLTWTDNSSNELRFTLERCQGDGCSNFMQISQPVVDAISASDIGLSSGTSYSYRIRAENNFGNSNYSNTATAVTLPGAGVNKCNWSTSTRCAVVP